MTDVDDYYTVLGIDRYASGEEIHRAYFALARQYHPDVNPDDPDSTMKFIKLQAAFQVLNDPAMPSGTAPETPMPRCVLPKAPPCETHRLHAAGSSFSCRRDVGGVIHVPPSGCLVPQYRC